MLRKIYKIKNIIMIFIVAALVLNFISIPVYADVKIVDEVKSILNNYYIEDIPKEILNMNSANDIINNLNDPYTQLMNPEEYNRIVNSTFYGIGITIEMTQTGAEITSVMVNSPAMKAGLEKGDIIVSVDDNYLSELSKSNAIKVLNGKDGVNSELRILRNNDELIVNIMPGIVYYPTVFSEVTDNNTVLLSIMSFGSNTYDEFEYAIKSFAKMKSIDKYVIDLRNNPGGFINSAVKIAGYFTKVGIVATAQTKDGTKFMLTTTIKSDIIDKQIIFLVNDYTASAAELLVGCAQDYGTAVIIGKKTYGKGVAQSTFKLSDDSILKTTTLRISSPLGREINNVGILPDIYLNNIDFSYAAELLLTNSKPGDIRKIAKLKIKDNIYFINMDKIKNNYYIETYRQLIGQATSVDLSNYSKVDNDSIALSQQYPILKYVGIPKTQYKIGDRIIFKLYAPNYKSLVQYRALLWNETTNRYVDIWNTNDRYYNKWSPKGNDVFTISFPATSSGKYRIKFFVKRNGTSNLNTALKGMNCDSYIYEIPYVVDVKS